MYEEHPVFNPPPLNTVLWRYMDFTKYVSLLEKQALFFARADKLGDPFEGSYTKVNEALLPVHMRRILREDVSESRIKQLTSGWADVNKRTRQSVLINCWHENPYESAAMWKLYSREEDGIAIKTNFDLFKASFICNQSIYIGRVNYVDYKSDFIPEGNDLCRYLHKRKSFEHEQEVRAINSRPTDPDDEVFRQLSQNRISGTYYEVDLSLLIQKVIVAPFAPDWFFELVKSVTTRYNFNFKVVRSTQADEPTWG